jgi:hypothetical protein
MDILGWLWWGIVKILGLVWSFVWFLLGGWVSTLMQLVILGGAIFAMKYGWRRAPQEMWTRAQSVGRFVWAWARAKEPRLATSARPEVLGSKEACCARPEARRCQPLDAADGGDAGGLAGCRRSLDTRRSLTSGKRPSAAGPRWHQP